MKNLIDRLVLQLPSLKTLTAHRKDGAEQHLRAFLHHVGGRDPHANMIKFGLIGVWMSAIFVIGLVIVR